MSQKEFQRVKVIENAAARFHRLDTARQSRSPDALGVIASPAAVDFEPWRAASMPASTITTFAKNFCTIPVAVTNQVLAALISTC